MEVGLTRLSANMSKVDGRFVRPKMSQASSSEWAATGGRQKNNNKEHSAVQRVLRRRFVSSPMYDVVFSLGAQIFGRRSSVIGPPQNVSTYRVILSFLLCGWGGTCSVSSPALLPARRKRGIVQGLACWNFFFFFFSLVRLVWSFFLLLLFLSSCVGGT